MFQLDCTSWQFFIILHLLESITKSIESKNKTIKVSNIEKAKEIMDEANIKYEEFF